MKTLVEYAARVNARLTELIPAMPGETLTEGEMPALLAESMRYSLLAGGKRLRPAMLLAAIDLLGGEGELWLDMACAVEMIHSYSLIHDDLPGMDDDNLRRGRPTNHVVYGVGQAILAGDGLLNYAFETMLKCALRQPQYSERALRAIAEIATGAGVTGMIAGQVADLYCEREKCGGERELSYIQRDKTACMFIYPLRAAARLCGCDGNALDCLERYGEAFGRLFQATDDLLDVVGDSGAMGKTLGKDAAQGKLTMISQYGKAGTCDIIARLQSEAEEALDGLDADADFFRQLVRDMVTRVN